MRFKYIRTNIVKFILSYFILIISFIFISYKFFLDDFIYLEKMQNLNNVNSLLHDIDGNLKNISGTTHDYSQWDDTYTFAQDKNKNYIYENFRDGTATLEGINIDAMLYLDIENRVFFSKYRNSFLESNKKDFEKYISSNLKNKNVVDTIINYKSKFLYLSKSEILKSDFTGKPKGYLISVKLSENKDFLINYSLFDEIKISTHDSIQNNLEINLAFLKNVKIQTYYENDMIINHINFYNFDGEYLISLISKNNSNIVLKGKKTILLFNLLISLILFLVFFYIYKSQYLIENQNSLLNEEVANRTKLLNMAYDKLKSKNNELFTLANIDSLTKIRNRRSYFIKSEELLSKAIKFNHNLHVLLIDLDHFKTINDTYGHNVGDKVLISFCNIVSSIIDKKIVFGRIGGEEFSLTFYNKTDEEVTKISEEIRDTCSNAEIKIDNKVVKFTVSMGLASREDFDNIDKILHNSDKLLYQAKKSGRNKLIRTNR